MKVQVWLNGLVYEYPHATGVNVAKDGLIVRTGKRRAVFRNWDSYECDGGEEP